MPTAGRRDQGGVRSVPTLAVSMGDPGGIGPEVLVRALGERSRRARARHLIVGSGKALHEAAEIVGVEPFWWRVDREADLLETASIHDAVLIDLDGSMGVGERTSFARHADRLGGELSYRAVEDAIALARPGAGGAPARADGIVTGPISKAAWAAAGHTRWPGHTELLAERFRAKRHAMMFVGPRLNVVLATVHLPLMEVRNVLTIGRVFDAIDLGAQACAGLGIERPRIAVCGLNPHAGEGGLLGDEETRLIEPAIELAVRQGIDASGPLPGDTVFNSAVAGRYDLVVAMYHDQGLIPVKLLDRDSSVNVTLGLGTVRTSPDHGTAFDIAGRGKADAGSTASAFDLAARLCAARDAGVRP
ncbi:MAG: 4-hydroxythreonine-4-phosphate dehydrogenase PdxA [Planctomycetota bacterium]